MRTGDVRLICADAELIGQRKDAVVIRREPGAAAVDCRAVIELLGPDAPTHSVACLEHGNRFATLVEPAGRGEPGVSGTHHAHVDIEFLCHERRTVSVCLRTRHRLHPAALGYTACMPARGRPDDYEAEPNL